jgi:hypothetical protein
LNTAVVESITLNGTTLAINTNLYSLGLIEGFVKAALDTQSIGNQQVSALSNNSGQSDNITLNTGENSVPIFIFYPSMELTASIDITINGVLETVNFEKIETA